MDLRTLTMQRSFSELEYAAKKRVTRWDRFLGKIEAVAPWSALAAELEPFYPTHRTWHVEMRHGKRKALPDTEVRRLNEQIERIEASIRAKVEHPFCVLENVFGLKKVRFRCLVKNTAQLFTLFGLANPVTAKRYLFELQAHGAS